jgi:hypothetical protein
MAFPFYDLPSLVLFSGIKATVVLNIGYLQLFASKYRISTKFVLWTVIIPIEFIPSYLYSAIHQNL